MTGGVKNSLAKIPSYIRAMKSHYDFLNVSAEHFDVKLVLDNGKQVTWGNVDLCEINTMDVYYDDQAGDFKAKWE